jgi:hypothetical protein
LRISSACLSIACSHSARTASASASFHIKSI